MANPDDPYAKIKSLMGTWPDGSPRKTPESRREAEKQGGPPQIIDIPKGLDKFKSGGSVKKHGSDTCIVCKDKFS